jgi:hypothetical protein
MGDPADGDQLEGQQGQHRGQRGDDGGPRVASGGDQTRQVQGDQTGHRQQQSGHVGLGPVRELIEVDDPAAGQRLASRRAPKPLGPTPQPGEALLGDHLGDAGAVERGTLGGEALGDLVDGMPRLAQLDDTGSDRLLGRGHLGPRAGGDEEVAAAGPELTHHGMHAVDGIPEPRRHLGHRITLVQIGPQGLVAALGGLRPRSEELPTTPCRSR